MLPWIYGRSSQPLVYQIHQIKSLLTLKQAVTSCLKRKCQAMVENNHFKAISWHVKKLLTRHSNVIFVILCICANSTRSPSALVQLGGLWGVVPHANFPDAACQSDRELCSDWIRGEGHKKVQKIWTKRPINSLIILGRKANNQGSHYEDHVTQISWAQAGGLLS